MSLALRFLAQAVRSNTGGLPLPSPQRPHGRLASSTLLAPLSYIGITPSSLHCVAQHVSFEPSEASGTSCVLDQCPWNR